MGYLAGGMLEPSYCAGVFSPCLLSLVALKLRIIAVGLCCTVFPALPARAEIVVYETDFAIMSGFESLTGQEAWGSNDPDLNLGYGAADGIARLVTPSESSNAGFLGGFYQDRFPPGRIDVLLWPELPVIGSNLVFAVDVVLVGSANFGPFSIDDVFGWCLCDRDGDRLLSLRFEPTSSDDSLRELAVYDADGGRHPSGFDISIGALYRFEITLSPESGGERAMVKILGGSDPIVVFDGLLPVGTIAAVDRVAASWEMAGAAVDPVTGIVSGFGSNFMVFDNLSVATTLANSVHVSDVWVNEAAGEVVVVAQLGQALGADFVIDYLTVGSDAVAGSDYIAANTVASPFVIPAGALQGSVSIPVLADEIAEADETFRLQFSSPSGGLTYTAPSATVTILDDDDTDGDGLANSWELAHGLDPDDPDDALLDVDGNGASALLDFALGVATDGVTGLPTLLAAPGEMVFTFQRNLAYTHLSYRVEISSDLADWSIFPSQLVATSGDIETRRALIPTGPLRIYVRLTIESPD